MKLSEQKLNVLCTVYQSPAKYIGGNGNQAKTIASLVKDGLLERVASGYELTAKGLPIAKAEYDDRKAERANRRSVDDEINDPVNIIRHMRRDLKRLQQQTISEEVAPDLAALAYELSQDVNIMSLIRHAQSVH
jgi:hypothetical protein